MAKIRTTRIGVGRIAQSGTLTPNVDADLMSFTKLNAAVAEADLVTEDDAQEIGKGHEYAENVYNSHYNAGTSFEKYISAQFLAWLFAFGLGNSTASVPGVGAVRHTAVPMTEADGDELPLFTMVEQIAGTPLDRALVGCTISDFEIMVQSGPGRQAAKVTANVMGTGKLVEPSVLVIPAVLAEKSLPAGSIGLIINGENYVTSKNIISATFRYNNNIRGDEGFYPGGGSQDNASIRGRMEYGDREISLNFVSRFKTGMTELVKLRAGTEGTLAWTMFGEEIVAGVNYDMSIIGPRVRFAAVNVRDANGIVTVEVDARFLYPPSDPIITCYATDTTALYGAE